MLKITIKGDAGEGKTVLMGEIARHLESLGFDVFCREGGEKQELLAYEIQRPGRWLPGTPVFIKTKQ